MRRGAGSRATRRRAASFAPALGGILLVFAPLACSSSGGVAGDPWEPFNRRVFAFNEGLDRTLLGPAAAAWAFVLPDALIQGIDNVYRSADLPFTLAHDLLQLELVDAAQDFARLVANLTLGLGGLVDAASTLGIPENVEDWGLTAARWGAPAGPYLVLPLFGASSVRDGIGRAADSVSRPLGYFVPLWQSFAVRSTDLLNRRALFRDEISQSRRDAFDFYVFVRNAHRENRAFLARDRASAPPMLDPSEIDLYGPYDLDPELPFDGEAPPNEDGGEAP